MGYGPVASNPLLLLEDVFTHHPVVCLHRLLVVLLASHQGSPDLCLLLHVCCPL